MKVGLAIVAVVTAWVLTYGSPVAEVLVERELRYGSPEPILPMTFAHRDHTTVNCVDCHHNYVDDTGGENCMHCHVVDARVWPSFEAQFHGLCRGCHERHAAEGIDGGPPRRCMACHRPDDVP